MKASHLRISFPIVLLVLISVLSGCTVPFGNFKYAGDKSPVTIAKSTHTTLILDLQISVGSITFEVDSTASYLVNVVNKVSIREGSDDTLAEAKEVTSSEIDSDTMQISFDSQDSGLTTNYKYDLIINVSNNIELQLNLLVTTGDIDVNLQDSTVTVSVLDVVITTGVLTFSIADVTLTDSSPTLQTTTGDQELAILNVHSTVSTLWSIFTTTGTINVDFTDNPPTSSSSLTHSFTIDVTTGDIDIISDLHQDVGLKITASVSTGTITLPGGSTSYTSSNFASSNLKYDFSLETTTGDIKFT